jgi:hypothetical protein
MYTKEFVINLFCSFVAAMNEAKFNVVNRY